MLVAALSLLFLYASVGMLLSALLASPPTGAGFWRLTLLMILSGGTVGVGLRVAGLSEAIAPLPTASLLALALAAAALVGAGVRSSLDPDSVPRPWLASASILALIGVALDPALLPAEASAFAAIVYVSGMLTVATALGSVLLAMILAHWYLIEPRLPIAPLQRVLRLFLATEAAKVVLLAALLAIHLPGWSAAPGGLLRSFVLGDALFVAVRAFLGILAPIGLGWMTWKTVEIRSIQSATGILYAAIVFVLFGEVISLYLSLSTGLPY